jgi:site-specific recombinase XerD
MKLSASVDAYLFERDYDPNSRRWFRQKLNHFVAWASQQRIFDSSQLGRDTLVAYTHYLRDTPSIRSGRALTSQTVHGYLRAVRAYLRWAIGEDIVDGAVFKKFRMPKVESHIVRPFTREQVAAMLRACEAEELPWLVERDRTILYTLLDTGIRAEELCGLTLTNTHLTGDEPYIVVLGKGSKERAVGLGQTSRKALHRWIHRFRPETDSPHIFVSKKTRTRMTPTGLDKLLYRLRDREEIDGVRCSAHTFRHTFAFNYILNGGDILRLSRILGHTSVAVTQEYLKAFSSFEVRGGQSVVDTMF